MDGKEKKHLLNLVLDQIRKDFGQESICRLGDKTRNNSVTYLSTGIPSLDMAVGGKGIPRGRIIEIYGPESSGKTTLCLSIVAEAQKNGEHAAYIDAEHALDPEYAKILGVQVDDLLVSQPDSGEQALEIIEKLVRSGAVAVVVLDSVAALVPRAEIAGDMGSSHVGLQARLMSQALRKLASITSRSNTCLIFINQLRQKIGVMYGNPETTTGGLALKFYSTIRMDIRSKEKLKSGDQVIGVKTVVKIVKNKIAPPFQKAEFDVMAGKGISKLSSLLDVAEKHNIVSRAGSWYVYQDVKLGQGKENAKNFLTSSTDIRQEIEEKVKKL